MVKSLAGSDREYTEIQGRIRDGVLHIQGEDDPVNRDYGVAVDVEVSPEFVAWLDQQEHTLGSLAGSGAAYVPMQVANRGVDIHIQVRGTAYNRPYGAALNVEGDAADLLAEFVGDEEAPDDVPTGTAVF